MGTKEKLIELLEQNRGQYISGEDAAESLGVSRTSVWKAIKSLQQQGHQIQAITNKGYCLSEESDVVTTKAIEDNLSLDLKNLTIKYVEESPSTNSDIIKNAENIQDGTVLVAASQSQGRGRRGRAFFSPKGAGIYFSLLLRPKELKGEQATSITTMAAVAVCKAIEKVSGQTAEIKWVNDIFVQKKKVCGILTEAFFDMETGFIDYAVLGVGINVYAPKEGYPKEIQDIAGYIFENPVNNARARIVAETLNNFFDYYNCQNKTIYSEEYKKRSFVIGKQIEVIYPDKREKVTALDVDSDCHLIVKNKNGEIKTLSTGEISICI